jgi:hypothetical protein
MTTTIKNSIPQSFVLSESFPNEEGIRGFFTHENNNSFFTSLEEKNKDKVSGLEKTTEVNGNALNVLKSVNTKNNKDYLIELRKLQEESILDHSTSTIVFLNVSNEFVNKLQSYQLHYNITRKDYDSELHFWLTPEYLGSKDASIFYLDLFNRFAKLKDTLKEKYNISDPREVKRLMPTSYGTNAIVTTGIKKWQEIITKATSFKEDTEMRFVFTNLAKNLKNRHQSLFMNIFIEDKQGKRFGFDTLKSSENAWVNYRVIFV